MRTAIVVIFMILVILPLFVNVYAQNEAISPLGAFGTYNMKLLQADKDNGLYPSAFLKTINSNPQADDEVNDTPIGKMSYGVINTVTAWSDIPKEMTREADEKSVLAGATLGFGEGLVNGFARGACGIYDIATFGFSPYDKPLLEPGYKVVNPKQEFKVNLIQW